MNRIALLVLLGLGCGPIPPPPSNVVVKLSDGTCAEQIAHWDGCAGNWTEPVQWVPVECVKERTL